MAKTFDESQELMTRLESYADQNRISKKAMRRAFELLSEKLGGQTWKGEAFPMLFVEIFSTLSQEAEYELDYGAVRYSEYYYDLSTSPTVLRMHATNVIVTLFGDENDPDCIKAVKMVTDMIASR